MQETALYYYAFWNTGRQQYLDKALAPGFVDNTLPKGRPQGPSGPVLASRTFQTRVADQLLLSNARVRLRSFQLSIASAAKGWLVS